MAADVIALMDALGIERAIIAGCDWGARTANIVAALWPERVKAMVSVSGYLIGSQRPTKAVAAEGRTAMVVSVLLRHGTRPRGYEKYRRDFARLIWQLASPKWNFDDATFDRSAAAFDNPDHVDDRDPQLPLAARPGGGRAQVRRAGRAARRVPGHRRPDDHAGRRRQWRAASGPAVYAKKFTGKYEHRLITGGIGHNLPQEAPGPSPARSWMQPSSSTTRASAQW